MGGIPYPEGSQGGIIERITHPEGSLGGIIERFIPTRGPWEA